MYLKDGRSILKTCLIITWSRKITFPLTVDGEEVLEPSFEEIKMTIAKLKRNKSPQEWKLSMITPIYKKGDKKECKNYRCISILIRRTKYFLSFYLTGSNRILRTLLGSTHDTKI